MLANKQARPITLRQLESRKKPGTTPDQMMYVMRILVSSCRTNKSGLQYKENEITGESNGLSFPQIYM